MCCVVEGRGPGWLGGCRRFDCPVSVRMPQMRWLTSASSAALMRARLPGWRMPPCRSRPVASLLLTGVTVGDFSGGGTALAGSLAEVTWGVGAGQGLLRGGECGGSRLVGSEKSPIVTLRRRVGLGGLIENVLTRTAFSHRARGWDLSHLQEIAVLAGYRIPRYAAGVRRSDAAGTVRRPAAARALREAGGSLCVCVAGHCQLREWAAARQG